MKDRTIWIAGYDAVLQIASAATSRNRRLANAHAYRGFMPSGEDKARGICRAVWIVAVPALHIKVGKRTLTDRKGSIFIGIKCGALWCAVEPATCNERFYLRLKFAARRMRRGGELARYSAQRMHTAVWMFGCMTARALIFIGYKISELGCGRFG